MSNVPIEFFNIARTQVRRDQVEKWLEFIGAGDYDLPEPDACTDPALLIALAAKRCYKSFLPGLNPNLTKVRTDLTDYIDNLLNSGHGSVFEHAVYSFAIENLSRVATGELNRHRAGWAISEGSMRFIRFDKDIPWWMPTSLEFSDDDDADLRGRKTDTRKEFFEHFVETQQRYARMVKRWEMDEGNKNFHYKKRVTSCLRRIVGMGCATGGVWTGNIRALRHVITMRAHEPSAEEEIFHIFSRIAEFMIEEEKMLFGDFTRDVKGSWVPEHRKV